MVIKFTTPQKIMRLIHKFNCRNIYKVSQRANKSWAVFQRSPSSKKEESDL